jgi:hypothetical protein
MGRKGLCFLKPDLLYAKSLTCCSWIFDKALSCKIVFRKRQSQVNRKHFKKSSHAISWKNSLELTVV